MTFHPSGDRILVEPIKREDITKAGIILPGANQRKPVKGTVLAVGDGRLCENGTIAPVRVKVGAVVYYGDYAGLPIEEDEGTTLLVMSETEVLGWEE